MSTGTPEVKPEVSFIYELLQELADGRLRIPGFQRPYVWRRDQMLDLLDSVHLQYPVGSILVWETTERYRTLDWVGPLRIPEPKASTALILDGQQRLSTLAGVLLPLTDSEPNPRDDDPRRWEIWFNAMGAEGEGSFEHPAESAPLQPWHFPMRKLMETIAFLEECQRIIAQGHEKSIEWINRIQRIAKVFQSYKIAVIRVKNTDIQQAVEIFTRLNSKGQRMSADQIVSALVYAESADGGFDLSRHIDELHSQLIKTDFGDVDRTTLLRLLLACLGEDVCRTDWTKIAREKRPNIASKLAAGTENIRESLTRAVDFLRECGVHHERLLPYAMQLVVLTGFFHSCPNPSETQRHFLRRWFWVSSFTGWGGGGNPSRVGSLVKEFSTEVAQNNAPRNLQNMQLDQPALPFPKNFDMRSARVRALLLVLFSEKPAGADGKPIHEPWRLVGQYGPEAIGYVLHRMRDRDLVSSPANRLLKPDVRSESHSAGGRGRSAQAKGWLVSLDDSVREDVLRSHAIPPNAYAALLANDPTDFIQRRQEYMINLELSFMQKEGVASPANATVPQWSPIDTDDEVPPLPPKPGDADE